MPSCPGADVTTETTTYSIAITTTIADATVTIETTMTVIMTVAMTGNMIVAVDILTDTGTFMLHWIDIQNNFKYLFTKWHLYKILFLSL